VFRQGQEGRDKVFDTFNMALTTIGRRYREVKEQPESSKQTYLFKLELKCYLEEVLKFVKNKQDPKKPAERYYTQPWSRRVTRTLLQFSEVFRHNKRLSDAIEILSNVLGGEFLRILQ